MKSVSVQEAAEAAARELDAGAIALSAVQSLADSEPTEDAVEGMELLRGTPYESMFVVSHATLLEYITAAIQNAQYDARHFTGVLPDDAAETSLPWEYEDTVPLAKDHPDMIAWEAYKATPGYANTLRWATEAQHTEGSLWAAFIAGRESTVPDIREPDGYVVRAFSKYDNPVYNDLIGDPARPIVLTAAELLQAVEHFGDSDFRLVVRPVTFGTPLQEEQEKQ